MGNDKHLKIEPNPTCMICSKYDGYFRSIEHLTTLFTLDECKIDFHNEYKKRQNVVNPRNLKLIRLEQEQIVLLYHVHHHLQYYPYQCVVKAKNDDKEETNKVCNFRVPFIGREFYDHLVKVHGISFNFENNNADCYQKSFYIEQLDRLVERLYVERRDDYKKMRR